VALLDEPYGWVWPAFAGWAAFRLLLVPILAAREAARLGRARPEPLTMWLAIVSAAAGAGFAALGPRVLIQQRPALMLSCLSISLGAIGFLLGMIGDLYLTVRVQVRLAGAMVARRAAEHADQLTSGEPEQRRHAARALAYIGPRASFAVTQLLGALADADPELRYLAAGALITVESDDPAVGPALRKALADADPRVRSMAAAALVKRGAAEPEQVLPALRDGLWAAEPDVWEWAAEALGQLGPRAAPAAGDLIELLGEDFARNHVLAIALERIGAAAVPFLAEKLISDKPGVRAAALEALAEMGSEAREAIPALRAFAADPRYDLNLRHQAVRALERIESALTG
jgi:HEAT repeat protein